MNKHLRKAVIAGNWKMNKTPSETTALINEMKPLVKDADCEVVLCVPFVDLDAALKAADGSNIKIGAENCHFEASGAFTGEVSAPMLKEMGVEYVIIGHSERRTYFGETDVTVNKRTLAALANGLKPIVCVGEYLEQREQGVTEELVAMQTKKSHFSGLPKSSLKTLSSLTSLFGQSALAKPQLLSRQMRFARLFATPLKSFTAKQRRSALQFNTAAL